jgi:co-chaperonin GroES (HSP10)
MNIELLVGRVDVYLIYSQEKSKRQIFLHNKCLQQIKEALVIAIDKINATFGLTKNVNLQVKLIEKLEVEVYDNCKFEQEDQDSTHQDNQDSIDKDFTLEQKDQDSTHKDDQGSTHHDDQD